MLRFVRCPSPGKVSVRTPNRPDISVFLSPGVYAKTRDIAGAGSHARGDAADSGAGAGSNCESRGDLGRTGDLHIADFDAGTANSESCSRSEEHTSELKSRQY